MLASSRAFNRCVWFALAAVFAAPLWAGEVDDFERSWTAKALAHQRTLDLYAPLAHATFITTHNSYNASDYSNLGSYWDPNHVYSISKQLRMGVRCMEFDVHEFFSTDGWPWEWGTELLLCHGTDNHIGCSTFDRQFSEGLAEVRDFLNRPENANEVVLIYLEEHIDDAFGEAVNNLRSYFGDKIFKPIGGCQGIPMDITKADILAAGKQIMFMTDGCRNGTFNEWVFTGVGNANGFPSSNPNRFKSYPDCSPFGRDQYNREMVRFFEDRTTLTDIFGNPGAPITAAAMREMMRCGVNLPGMDELRPYDGRLQSAVWSWNSNEPNDHGAGEDCGEHIANGRFNDIPCDRVYSFACKDPDTGEWYITSGAGSWSEGNDFCNMETGGRYVFAVPVSGYENEKLKEAKIVDGLDRVWLNYSDGAVEGEWVPNALGNRNYRGKWLQSGGRDVNAENNVTVTFTVTGTENIQFDLASAVDTYLYLVDEYGAIIADDDDGGSGYNSRLSLTLQAGRYRLVAATYNPGQAAPFTLTTTKGSFGLAP